MAGSYPDVPGYRFAYDLDGTVILHYGLTATALSSDWMTEINDDRLPATRGLDSSGLGIFCILFPEPRSVTGIYLNRSAAQNMPLEYSTDTTNGVDGTWSTALAAYSGESSVSTADARVKITSLSIASCTSLRFHYPTTGSNGHRQIRNLHIYGSILPTESPSRLRVIDMTDASTTSDGSTQTGDDISAQLDFGNIAQRASVTRQFKVVNNSSSQTADNITVSLDVPTDANPSLLGQYQVSTDNNAFANAINIGSLAPGADSGTLYVRMNPANNAQLGPWSARIIAHPTSWSEA